jgi:hypothetical protein
MFGHDGTGFQLDDRHRDVLTLHHAAKYARPDWEWTKVRQLRKGTHPPSILTRDGRRASSC